MPGLIKLVGKGGGTMKSGYYFRPSDITEYIERWRCLYGLKFENYFIHTIPNLKDQRSFNNPNKIKNETTKTRQSD
jgi:hypothetical protein